MVRMPSTLITEKLAGRNIQLEMMNGDVIEGILEHVTSYELGLRSREGILVVFRHAIKSARVRENEVMGIVKDCCEEQQILDSGYVGYDVVVRFISGGELSGKLLSVSKYEIAISSGGYAYILNKGSISYVKLIQ